MDIGASAHYIGGMTNQAHETTAKMLRIAAPARAFQDAFKASGETYASLSRKTDIPETTLKRWINSRPGHMSLIGLFTIAEALGVDCEIAMAVK